MGAPTYTQAAGIVARRVGPWIALADLTEALAYAVRNLGREPADAVAVADGDLAGLDSDQVSQLYDVAEWRATATAAANCEEVLLRTAGFCGDADKLRMALEKRADKLMTGLQLEWGVGRPTLAVGVAHLNFAADGQEYVQFHDEWAS